jgi:ATP-dependent Lon protease
MAPPAQAELTVVAPVVATTALAQTTMEPAPAERHFTILYGDTGHTYETIMGPYVKGAKAVQVEDPYIRLPHQIQNFVRFCEAILKAGTVRKISLLTSFDDTTPLADMNDKLDQLRQSLLEQDVELEINVNPNLHDREIRLDNGWVIKIGRGLDFYQRPSSWFEIGSMDMSLRKCLETKVDIFMVGGYKAAVQHPSVH